MKTFAQLESFAATAQQYREARGNMKYRAIDAFHFAQGEDPIAQNMEQFTCRHSWVINEETDRCYCCYCGMDGDA